MGSGGRIFLTVWILSSSLRIVFPNEVLKPCEFMDPIEGRKPFKCPRPDDPPNLKYCCGNQVFAKCCDAPVAIPARSTDSTPVVTPGEKPPDDNGGSTGLITAICVVGVVLVVGTLLVIAWRRRNSRDRGCRSGSPSVHAERVPAVNHDVPANVAVHQNQRSPGIFESPPAYEVVIANQQPNSNPTFVPLTGTQPDKNPDYYDVETLEDGFVIIPRGGAQ